MRRSEFTRAVLNEFGEYGAVVCQELSLTAFHGLSANEAVDAGFPLREIWLEICRLQDVPPSRQYGVGRIVVEESE